MTQLVEQQKSHLSFYRKHNITPVRYDLTNLKKHLQRRRALYCQLGLLPVSFKGASLLEVAAGTGQNSLYIAACMPNRLVLLEPNEAAQQYIKVTYQEFCEPHQSPQVLPITLEAYESSEQFDIVICENWLGRRAHELILLKKLASCVSNQGALVLTSVSPVGLIPNMLRRYLASFLVDAESDFLEQTACLVAAFQSHLVTLTDMTRSVKDWVQDNLLNPAYFDLALSLEDIHAQIGQKFCFQHASPNFISDWRWFKNLHGNHQMQNKNFIQQYNLNAHNFVDYRFEPTPGDLIANDRLSKVARLLIEDVRHMREVDLQYNLQQFIQCLPPQMQVTREAFMEVLNFVVDPKSITIDRVSHMTAFNQLFGRETVYVSLLESKNGQE